MDKDKDKATKQSALSLIAELGQGVIPLIAGIITLAMGGGSTPEERVKMRADLNAARDRLNTIIDNMPDDN